jgi:diaminohydroxyphosphoribosylaminopyrimidine deaminase/5-amino-6-(5-phosphoribosylamino)uracil reductase
MDLDAAMAMAVEAAQSVRHETPPNPWVGAVVLLRNGAVAVGATAPPGGPHAEVAALAHARALGDTAGATVVVTLEPCCHTGRTGPCTEALIDAKVAKVVVAIVDPDPKVAGKGIAALEAAGIEVVLGLGAEAVEADLAPYLHHRRTGRPEVVVKLAATIDGRTAAPDGTSKWITGEAARRDAHALRATCQAIVVGRGTVLADDPALTVRLEGYEGPQPARIVLGEIPDGAAVLPARSYVGPLDDLLDDLGAAGVLRVLVEGGAALAHAFVSAGLVDRFVVYLAPAMMGGDDGRAMFAGPGAPTLAAAQRGRFVSSRVVGDDLRVEVVGR